MLSLLFGSLVLILAVEKLGQSCFLLFISILVFLPVFWILYLRYSVTLLRYVLMLTILGQCFLALGVFSIKDPFILGKLSWILPLFFVSVYSFGFLIWGTNLFFFLCCLILISFFSPTSSLWPLLCYSCLFSLMLLHVHFLFLFLKKILLWQHVLFPFVFKFLF